LRRDVSTKFLLLITDYRLQITDYWLLIIYYFFSLTTACAAANLAIGTLNGEQDT
jgi:hypothetical protein